MKLFGDWNWYLPKWLEWLPHLEHGGKVVGRAELRGGDICTRRMCDHVRLRERVPHATPGQGGEKLTKKYFEAAKGPKEYWAAPGGHTGAIDAAPAEYERRVLGFFDRALRGDEAG